MFLASQTFQLQLVQVCFFNHRHCFVLELQQLVD